MGGKSSSGSAGRPAFGDFLAKDVFAEQIGGIRPGYPVFTSLESLPSQRPGTVRVFHSTGAGAVAGIAQGGVIAGSQGVVNASTSSPWSPGIVYVADLPRASVRRINDDWIETDAIPKSAIRGIWLHRLAATPDQAMAAMTKYKRP